jgi:8-amino-7-oxononanoate synthase
MLPDWVRRDLESLDASDSRRRTTALASPTGPCIRVKGEGRERINFSSNDYLSLAGDSRLARAVARSAETWGSGSGASRLICGTLGLHEELESALARLKAAETAVLFSTGYQANLGILQALMPDGVVFSDELNHASIVDGCRLARARTVVYRHCDASHLAELLGEAGKASRKLIITDGVFSMDGDLAPLPDLVALARQHEALLVVDDAHATGVVGAGRGTAHHFGVEGEVDVHMGTLGKALGGFGAFAACSAPLRELLVNRARSLIYTTAPPPPTIGAGLEALKILEEEPDRVEALARNGALLRKILSKKGFDVPEAPTPIVPLVLGENRRALEWSHRLWQQGFWVHAIRPPTVPPGTARLRITVSSGHTPTQIEALGDAVGRLLREDGRREVRVVA